MLTVKGQRVKTERSTSEHAFEERWAEALASVGLYSRHMADRNAGVPDRYIQGGRWIEFKSLFAARGKFSLGEGLTTEQHTTCKALAEAEDEVWYCALLESAKGRRFIFIPYHVIVSVNMRYGGCDFIVGANGLLVPPGEEWRGLDPTEWSHEYKGAKSIIPVIPKDWYK